MLLLSTRWIDSRLRLQVLKRDIVSSFRFMKSCFCISLIDTRFYIILKVKGLSVTTQA